MAKQKEVGIYEGMNGYFFIKEGGELIATFKKLDDAKTFVSFMDYKTETRKQTIRHYCYDFFEWYFNNYLNTPNTTGTQEEVIEQFIKYYDESNGI